MLSYKVLDKGKAEVTYRVDEVIRGDLVKGRKITSMVAQNVNFGIPENESSYKKCFGSKSEVGLRHKNNTYKIVQEICNLPYIFPLPEKKQDPFCLIN